MRDREDKSMNIFSAIMFGAIMGSAATYLMNQSNRDRVQQTYDRLRNKTEDTIDVVKDKAHDIRLKANDKAEELEEKANETTEKAKRKV